MNKGRRSKSSRPVASARRWLIDHRHETIWILVLIVSVVVIVTTLRDHQGISDLGSLALNILLLFITALTLHIAIPDQARIAVDYQCELESSDLIFYVEGDNNEGAARDIHLQYHVAVSNVGGRKAVLSRLDMMDLLDGNGDPVKIGFGNIRATQYRSVILWKDTSALLKGQQNNMEHFTVREESAGPFFLAPDDVIALRLRARFWLDWSEDWTLARLRELATSLQQPVESIRLAATYRRGSELVTDTFVLPITPVQQSMYLASICFHTDNLTTEPTLEVLPRPPFPD